MWHTYFKKLLLLVIVGTMFISCDPVAISIDPPVEGVEFSVVGQIDGMDVNMAEDVILFTHTRDEGTIRYYGGQLHSNCENLNVNNCNQSFSITILDSLGSGNNSEGFPILLEPGEKKVYTHDVPNNLIHSICFTPTFFDTLIIDNQPTTAEYCMILENDSFLPIEMMAVLLPTNPTGNFYSYSTDIMARVNGIDIEYYHFSFACVIQDTVIQLTINLEGNTTFTKDNFDFYILNGGGINPNVDMTIPISPFEPLDVNLMMVNRLTGSISTLWIFGVLQIDSLTSFTCDFPVAIAVSNIMPQTNEGIALIEYQDESGELFSSLGTMSADQSFIINSTDPYIVDDAGNETVTSSITFNGKLISSSGRQLECKNLEMQFGFGFPSQ